MNATPPDPTPPAEPVQALPGQTSLSRSGLFNAASRLYTETFLDEWGARRAYRGRIVALVFLLLMIGPIRAVIVSERPAWQITLTVAGLVVFSACFVIVVWRNTPVLHHNRAAGATVLGIAAGAALLPVMGSGWLVALSLYTVSMLIFNFDRRFWKYFLIAVPLADVVTRYGIERAGFGAALDVAAQTFLVGLIQAAFFGQIRAKVELRRARADLARFAVIEERLRISRDLHDILGQRLSALSLKAEVAARLTMRDPDAAAREMTEVADVARSALADVRETVSGYRSVSMASEVETARVLLAAAGISLTTTVAPLPAAIDECAGWFVREAVTNIIRHASAANCVVRVVASPTSATVEVRDDGDVASLRGGGQTDPAMEVIYGNGLTGLSERVATAGGTLTTLRERGWFMVRATFESAGARVGEAGGTSKADVADLARAVNGVRG